MLRAHPGSDLDLLVVLADDGAPAFRPAPPVGSVPTHLARLPRQPAGCRDTFGCLLLGDAPERAAAFVELARWAAAALDAASGDQPDDTSSAAGM